VTVHISFFIRLFCIVTMVAIMLNGVAMGLPGAWYGVGMMAVIYAFSSRRLIQFQPLIMLVSLALCFYFGLRLWDYLVWDVYEIVSFRPVVRMVLSGTGADSLQFAMYATLMIYAGLVLAAMKWTDKPRPAFEPYHPNVNGDYFFVAAIGLLLVQIVLNYSMSDFIGGASTIIQLLAVATSHETLLPVVAMIYARAVGWKPRLQLVAFILGIVISRMVGGSRSAPLDVAEIMLAWAVIPGNWDGVFKINRNSIFLFLFLFFGSIAGFVAGTMIRAVQYDAVDNQLFDSQRWEDLYDLALLAYRQVAYRVGTNLDTLMFVFSNYYDSAYANAHVNLNTVWQTTLRRVFSIPMDPNFTFDEFELGLLVGNRGSWVNGQLFPTSYSWGIFAYFYQLFGYWALAVLLGLFFGIGRVFNALLRASPSVVRDISLFWTAHAMELLVPMFGISNVLGRGRGAVISFLLIWCLLYLFMIRKRDGSGGPVATQGSRDIPAEMAVPHRQP